ncbi:uncharacterized protein DS421_5g151110 [Arachis hypogaea]|nr:uncharacterized protein DS421_5g151110 [Arachis hypogaea]
MNNIVENLLFAEKFAGSDKNKAIVISTAGTPSTIEKFNPDSSTPDSSTPECLCLSHTQSPSSALSPSSWPSLTSVQPLPRAAAVVPSNSHRLFAHLPSIALQPSISTFPSIAQPSQPSSVAQSRSHAAAGTSSVLRNHYPSSKPVRRYSTTAPCLGHSVSLSPSCMLCSPQPLSQFEARLKASSSF